MASFSGAIRIGDLNDFIAPSQACVVSLNGNKLETKDEQEVSRIIAFHAEGTCFPFDPTNDHLYVFDTTFYSP
jgi:hypothetical protein